jgi:thioredoxin 1
MKTVIKFSASWCRPCKVYSPIFHKVAEKYPNIKFVEVDIDEDPEKLVEEYEITKLPTTVVLRENVMTQKKTDILTEEALEILISLG